MITFIIFLCCMGGVLFVLIQDRIGIEQESTRRQIVRDNPQLMFLFQKTKRLDDAVFDVQCKNYAKLTHNR